VSFAVDLRTAVIYYRRGNLWKKMAVEDGFYRV
jgi:hypothetical protein